MNHHNPYVTEKGIGGIDSQLCGYRGQGHYKQKWFFK